MDDLPYEEVPTGGGGDFKNIEAGIHNAICFAVIRLGTQETEFNGEKKRASKVMLRFEAHSEGQVTENGEPLIIGKRYTFSLHEKSALYANLKGWIGVDAVHSPDFNLYKQIGKPCVLVLSESKKGDKTYTNIDNIAAYRGQPLTMHNKPVAFSLVPKFYKQETFDALPEWIRDIIIKSPEFLELYAAGLATPHKATPLAVKTGQSAADQGIPAWVTEEVPL